MRRKTLQQEQIPQHLTKNQKKEADHRPVPFQIRLCEAFSVNNCQV